MPDPAPQHALVDDGDPHDELGRNISSYFDGPDGPGRARCSCWVLSGVLTTRQARKGWHRDHCADAVAPAGGEDR